ncbi:MAG: hypothetical protein OSJ69_09235 [Acetatifactor sp.]|nr:hypothetical protein [Acetatifactor sp.]
MTHRPARKKIFLLGSIFLLVTILLTVFLFLLWYRRQINNIELLQNYRISYTDSTTESAELLKQLCNDRLQLDMRHASESSHLFLRLAGSSEEAENLGFPLQGIGNTGFRITHYGNTVYLLSPSTEGLQRACYYLVFRLADENGRLLLALDENYTDIGFSVKEDILIGNNSLNDYSLICDEALPSSLNQDLAYYINQACGALPGSSEDQNGSSYIRLLTDETLPADSCRITASDGNISISGADEKSLSRGICQFANTYLGWMYAGTDREALSGDSSPLHIPSEIRVPENPWIEERGTSITLWKVNFNRGVFYNTATSLKNDILSFSDEQLYEYVRMLKFCGFTDVQATDMCAAWASAGDYKYVHERLRILADAAHSLDMKFTLWVWGTAFTGFGWADSTAVYTPGDYDYAYQNPDVLATFEKYYSIYSELADCCDRLIMHVYDPGFLAQSEDVAFFAKMLYDKFKGINPQIDFGINCMHDAYDKKQYLNAIGNDITFYAGAEFMDTSALRTFANNTGCRLGAMAWNNCEMELDQLAQMNYNPHIIQSVYLDSKQYDNIMKPQYWAEMDCYHILNVFSLYCAGQMLIDPSRDPEELTYEIAVAAVGTEYADAFADILVLIEDARTGKSWDTFWWSSDNYILKSDAYPAEEILARSEQALSVLQEMIDADLEANTLPLPLKLREVLQLIQPHIRQIRDFARFRIGLHEAEDMVAEGLSKDAVQAQIDSISTPVSEYNTVIGLWGQVEARAQQELLLAFCRENDLEMPVDATFDYERKFRIYSQFIMDQKGKKEIVYHYAPYYQYNLAYDPEVTNRLAMELVEEGLFSVDEATGALYLTDWEHYSYSFN